MYKEMKQVYNPQTGTLEPVEQNSKTVELPAADMAESQKTPAISKTTKLEFAQPGTPQTEFTETQVREEKSGGATIVDFNYEKYAEVERKATNTNATAGLTFGILSLIANIFAGFIGLILGIIGLVFSIQGRRTPDGRTMATAGMVCSIIGIVIGVLEILATIFFLAGLMTGSFY